MTRLLALSIGLLALIALACDGSGSDEPDATETSASSPTATFPAELLGFSVTLERTECFGTCPSYTVTVRGDGSVLYEGRRFVAAVGERTAAIPIDDVRRLVDKIEEVDYFSLQVPTVTSPEICTATDAPGYATAVLLHGRQRRIARCPSFQPSPLAELEDLIDQVAGTERWIGDRGLD